MRVERASSMGHLTPGARRTVSPTSSRRWALTCALALVGCADPRAPVDSARRGGVAPGPRSPRRERPTSCAAAVDFLVFLRCFEHAGQRQRETSRHPIVYGTVVEGAEGPFLQLRRVPHDSVTWPIYPDPARRRRDGLEVAIDSARADRREVVLAKPDTDYQLEYHFERVSGGGWRLVRYVDASP